jgi:hypothetical protein
MDQHGTAHLTNQMVALAARTNQMEALEARTQTDLLQLEENQSQLAHAYKISQTNHVPSEVRTEPSTLRSSVTGPASAYFTTNDINITNLTTENFAKTVNILGGFAPLTMVISVEIEP